VAKWVLPEPDTPQADRLSFDVANAGARLIALDLARVEVGNAIWKRYIRGLLTAAETLPALNTLLGLPIQLAEANRLLQPGLQIATRYRRAFYDSLFVALAQDLGVTGVTADEPLYRAVHSAYPSIILLRDWPPGP
jgi:predicted nucleic acid-binding protein